MSSSDTPMPLPDHGRERDIFLVAVSQMSNRCEAPSLTPLCPFYEPTPDGPHCAEQCIDLLAAAGGVPQRSGPIVLGSGIEAERRPRPRRAPGGRGASTPFDAAKIQLNDRSRVTREKSTVSLLRDVRDLVLSLPAADEDLDDREYRVKASWTELDRRGVDVDAVVRFALGRSIALGAVVAGFLDESTAAGADPITAGWRELMIDLHGLLSTGGETTLEDFLRTDEPDEVVMRWVLGATPGELAGVRVPTIDELVSTSDAAPSTERVVMGLWLHDRFCNTYVSEWHPVSLAQEWLYLHGAQERCVPLSAMSERYVAPAEIEPLLADQGARTILRDIDDRSRPRLTSNHFAAAAAGYLNQGNPEAAANLFRAIIEIADDDADAHNNLGFCLIPTDPTEAYEQLRRAAELRETFNLVTAANQCLVLHVLGRDEEALAAVNDVLSQRQEEPVGLSYLWSIDDHQWPSVQEVASVEAWLQDLQGHIVGGVCHTGDPPTLDTAEL